MGNYTMLQATFVFLLARHVISLPPPPEYPTPAPTQEYNPDIGQTNVGGYGVNKNPYCHMVEKVVFKNQCEPYTEQTCWTQNVEDCKPVMYNNCTGVIETDIERVCFDVNELVATWLKQFIMKRWKKPIRSKGVSPAKIEFVIRLTRLT